MPAPAESGGDVPAMETAQPVNELQAPLDAASAQLATATVEIARLTAELAASVAAQTDLATKIETADAAVKAMTAERDEAQRKLRAIEAGQPPVSSQSAPSETKARGSMWAEAHKNKKAAK